MGHFRAIFQRSGFARLAATASLGLTIFLVLLLGGVYLLVARQLSNRAETLMQAERTAYAELYTQRLLPGLREAVERRAEDVHPPVHVLLLGREGEVLAGDKARFPAYSEGMTPSGWRVRREELRGGFRLLIALDMRDDHAFLARLASGLTALGLALGVMGVYASLWIGRTNLRQVEVLSALLARVETGDLSVRYPDTFQNNEFSAIGTSLNTMLDRMQALVNGLKEVSDRVAHEMRTPLAHLRAGLDGLRRTAPAEQRAALADLVAETDDLITVFSALLDIATTEAAASTVQGLTAVPLLPIIEDVLELYDAVAEERGVALHFEPRDAMSLLGDRALLLRMLANLIDNAIKFSPEGGQVIISLARSERECLISLRDFGPGLPEGFGGKAFERFSRAPGAETVPGHGLGLALVRAIAIRHGLKITLENAHPGLLVILRGRVSG